jgi:EAL domain-containing protein (putative c-di-GMP-specific phosphodiesterase class I)
MKLDAHAAGECEGATMPSDVEQIISGGRVRALFQPIVDLGSGAVVGYEALSRGPSGPMEFPDVLFAAARASGLLQELDELCVRNALASARSAAIGDPMTLFVNVEPESVSELFLERLIVSAREADSCLQLVLEVTERALDARPADLLRVIRRLRRAGWRIALDDVGADDLSLAFMSLLQPDIVKLDMSLVQGRPTQAGAQIMNAVNAYAERTGCTILAEGIETQAHLDMALAMGATLGQGWLFGRPTRVVPQAMKVRRLGFRAQVVPEAVFSPFEDLTAGLTVRRSTKQLLVQVSKTLEAQAALLGPTALVLSTFQNAANFSCTTAERYRELGQKVGFVAVFGQGMGSEPVAGVRGNELNRHDPIVREWDIVVLSPHFAAALLANDLAETGPGGARLFEFVVTYDRRIVERVAETLLTRIRSASPS